MPKVAKQKSEKIKKYIDKYPNEFVQTPACNLFCKLCDVVVKYEKEFHVTAHRNTQKHKNSISFSQIASPNFLVVDKNCFADKLLKAFLSADIPLYKLRNESIKNLFYDLGHQVPSDTSCRQKIENICNEVLNKIQSIVQDQRIILYADESEVNGDKYFVVQMSLLENPKIVYTVECKYFQKSLNSNDVCQSIDDVVRKFHIKRENFVLFLSDAAPYMWSAGKSLKTLYSNLQHVTCMSHLLHNCCMRIRLKFEAIDELIASMRIAILKNNERNSLFGDLPKPPDVVLTRWGTWLNAVLYYSKHFNEIKEIVSQFRDEGKIVERVKKAIENPNVFSNLTQVTKEYKCLIELLAETENLEFSIEKCGEKLKQLPIQADPAEIKSYIAKRFAKNDIKTIWEKPLENMSPDTYGLLLQAPCSSATVERSFSRLKKLLAKDRNFNVENVKNYFICLMNEL